MLLVDDIEAYGRPSDEWIATWSRGNGDPIQDTWSTSGDAGAMAALLRHAIRLAIVSIDSRIDASLGADGLRAMVRELPPLREWLIAAQVHRTDKRDPIAQLVSDLRTEGVPRPAWVAQWSKEGRDPIAAAWQASIDSDAMRELLLLSRRHDLYAAAREAVQTAGERPSRIPSALKPDAFEREVERQSRAMAETLRAAVPVPPRLAEVLRARRSGGE